MIYEAYAVYDRQIHAFMLPFMCRTKGEAIRMFAEAVNDERKNFGKYATDYALHYLGTFDDNSGMFGPCDPTRIVSANEVLDQPEVISPGKNVSGG